ncbi:hypothetical protein N3K66_003185 [Trichothecium roseum]|uniref:Uncharacterized protein n=1 Tax=Trichothecium roseum TaxID=47278 RepID=A0ACC0V500_9HYPO|nr:hypothetical protein N3K66_003185 [Trichothecium roseum]
MSTKRKAPVKLAAPVVKPAAKNPIKSTINESRTSVTATDNIPTSQSAAIEISSDEEEEEESDEDMSEAELDLAEEQLLNGNKTSQANGAHAGQLPSPNHSPNDEGSDDEATSPTFGELLRDNEAIDVPALLQQTSGASNALAPTRTAIVPPRHQSLTTVLSQALRTDDTELLESCLHTTDLATIRNTIENIDSSLAASLLTKLAARLYRRPGRAGSLMTWVQWTLVAHGGAISSQPKVLHQLGALQKVLAERAKGLNSLLALKGKLDLLEGQMDLRRKMQRNAGIFGAEEEDDEDDEDVVYVEGEENEDKANGIGSGRRAAYGDDLDDDDLVNGVLGDTSDEEDDSIVEIEDSEGADESLDEDEVDHDDVDESLGEEEESDVEAAPPVKVRKTSKAFPKRK